MSRRERFGQALRRAGRALRSVAAGTRDVGAEHPVAVRWGKRLVLAALSIAATIGALWLLVAWAGLLDAIIYTVLFIVGLALLPFLIALLGHDVPFNGVIGRLHVLLGALAFNHHYLVDLGDKWEWCPGGPEHVYIEGQWYEIADGFENRSVLGWRPFGILRFKDEETLREVRADTAAEKSRGGAVTADGGTPAVKRGGYDEGKKPPVTGIDGEWLVDLKRLFSRGVRQIGDVELVETAEEVIERGEVTESAFEGWRSVIGAMMGLIFGCVMGYMLFFG